ncbi:MAG: malectin domain-containing carbohydrate-binding protein [Verrucomicrobiota bacterium]
MWGCDQIAKSKAEDTDVVLRINCGGPEIDGWMEDEKYSDGTGRPTGIVRGTDFTNAIDPGPPSIYQTVRSQSHRYSIPLPNGRYRVRLHFVDTQRSAERAMDYRVNGTLVIDNLCVEEAAGGTKRAVVLEVVAEVKDNEPLLIDAYEDQGTGVFQAGIEIVRASHNEPLTTEPLDLETISANAAMAQGNPSREIRAMTGAPTRVVWLEAEKWMIFTKNTSRVRLMGLDTEDGAGPRDLIGRELPLSKPLITPDGEGVIVSDRYAQRILHVDWDSGEVRDLAEGWASDVWADPKSGRSWVYHRSGKGHLNCPIRRFPLDDPNAEENVWTQTETGHEGAPWFQISGDGLYFVDSFPWPNCGWGNLEKDNWEESTRGCWPGISPDNSYRKFVLKKDHRELTIFDGNHPEGHTFDITNIPGQEGQKIYHPQWSNHPRYLSLTSPQRSDRNEIYLGRFDTGWKSVDKWVRITYNDRSESFSDVWVSGG